MRTRFDGSGGIQGLFGDLLGSVGQRTARIGEVVELKAGQCLVAPPHGKLWYQPSWAPGLFQLNDLVHHPVFEVGDVFGIHPEDPIPLPPSGTQLERLGNAKAPLGSRPAAIYKVVQPPELAAVMALPKPRPPVLQARAVLEFPQPEPGRRWQVAYVDGRNLHNVMGAMVAA